MIPKPNLTEICHIHDCSCPHGYAFNKYIEMRSFKFQTLDDAIVGLEWPDSEAVTESGVA